jgi:hypothetical protein
MADRINLPMIVVDRANNFLRQVHDGMTLKGRANDAVVPHTLKELCCE